MPSSTSPLPSIRATRSSASWALNRESGTQEPLRLGDYESLRTRLTSFASVGAALFREVNVISDDGRAEGARGAEMSASSFALTRVPPALGRVIRPMEALRVDA